jgi:hypothetical protein
VRLGVGLRTSGHYHAGCLWYRVRLKVFVLLNTPSHHARDDVLGSRRLLLVLHRHIGVNGARSTFLGFDSHAGTDPNGRFGTDTNEYSHIPGSPGIWHSVAHS